MKLKEIFNTKVKMRYVYYVFLVLTVISFCSMVAVGGFEFSTPVYLYGITSGFAAVTIFIFAIKKDVKEI